MKSWMLDSVRIAGAFLTLALLFGCGGSGNSLPDQENPGSGMPGVPKKGQHSLVFPVIMQPQSSIEFPERSLSWPSPNEVLKQLPAGRETSCDGTGWLLTGSMFEDGLPNANVTREGAENELARFSPDWQSGDDFSEASYAIYHWNMRSYKGGATMGFTWDPAATPTDFSKVFIGFSNYTETYWEWYEGPADGVLTVPSFGPFRDADGGMLVMVLLLGNEQAVLKTIEAGAPEVRGTGADELPSDGIGDYPVLGGSGNLPSNIDLSSQCAPVGDQGNWGSCTAWAVGDGAYNFELGMIYGGLGWDLTQDRYRVSPDYLYVMSGELGGYPPGGDSGRYTEDVFQLLSNYGGASLQHAPYDLVYDPDFNQDCDDDAAVLKISNWQVVDCSTNEGLNTVKAILAMQHKVLPMQMYLDYSFFDYTGGVWEPDGSPIAGGHAMCIVGYDEDAQAFKVRNSWGPYWGEDGYIWIAYSAFLDYYTSALAFTLKDEYDPAVVARFGLDSAGLPPVVGVAASDGTAASGIDVAWTAYSGADGFRIYRDAPDNLVQEVPEADAVLWNDQNADDGYGHVYWVRAVSGAQEGALSAPDAGFASHAPQLLSVNPTEGIQNDEKVFTVSGFGSGSLSYSWDFGGGATPNTSTEPRPTVVLSSVGTHQASVTVSNEIGSDTFNFDLVVSGIQPIIRYIAHRSGYDGDSTTLKPSIEGLASTYAWDLGGGATPNTPTAEQPTVTLGAPGQYSCSLTVDGPSGSDKYYFYLAVLDSGAVAWPVPGHDGRNSGQSPVTGPQDNNVKWKYFAGVPNGGLFGNHIYEVLALSNGDIIVGSETTNFGSTLRRLHPDGTCVWSKVHSDENWAYGQPMLSRDRSLVIVNENLDLVAFNAADGSEVWRVAALGLLPVPETATGKLMTSPDGKNLIVIRASDGTTLSGPTLLADSVNSFSVATLAPNGTLFLPSRLGNDKQLINFDTINEVPLDRIDLVYAIKGLAVSADGITIYSNQDMLVAMDVPTCMPVWGQSEVPMGFRGPRVMADGSVLISSAKNIVSAMNSESGELIWDIDLANTEDNYSSPAIGRDGTVYIGGTKKKVYAIKDGNLVWQSEDAATPRFQGNPSLGPDGTLYVGDYSGYLWAFGPGSGSVFEQPYVDSVSPLTGEEGSSYSPVGTYTHGSPASYAWNFGGGAVPNTSSSATPNVTLASPGFYNCTLQASNAYGSHTYSFQLEVTAAPLEWTKYKVSDNVSPYNFSLALVNGKPAMGYTGLSDYDAHYAWALQTVPLLASDWNSGAITNDDNNSTVCSIIDVGGKPVASVDGTTIGIADSASPAGPGNWTLASAESNPGYACAAMSVEDGKLALYYADFDNGQNEYVLYGAHANSLNPGGPADWSTHEIYRMKFFQYDLVNFVLQGTPALAIRSAYNDDRRIRVLTTDATAPGQQSDWTAHKVFEDGDSNHEVGAGLSACLIDGKPMLSYLELTSTGNSYLTFARSSLDKPDSTDDWICCRVDLNEASGNTALGSYNGYPAIAYADKSDGHLKIAVGKQADPSVTNDWVVSSVDDSVVSGGNPRMLVSGGRTILIYVDGNTFEQWAAVSN